MGRMTCRSSYCSVPLLGWQGRLGGRLGLPCGPSGTSESTGIMSLLSEAVPRRSLSRNFTGDVICNSADHRICLSSCLLTSPDFLWNKLVSGVDVLAVDQR